MFRFAALPPDQQREDQLRKHAGKDRKCPRKDGHHGEKVGGLCRGQHAQPMEGEPGQEAEEHVDEGEAGGGDEDGGGQRLEEPDAVIVNRRDGVGWWVVGHFELRANAVGCFGW